jgi:hypothetical protein
MIHSGESFGGRALNFLSVINLKIIKPPCFSTGISSANLILIMMKKFNIVPGGSLMRVSPFLIKN